MAQQASRTVNVQIAGVTYAMPVTFGASQEICQTVILADGTPADVVLISSRAFARGGVIDLTLANVVRIIYIGANRAGCSLSEDDIGEAIVAAGISAYMKVAGEYLGAFLAGVGTAGQRSAPKTSRGDSKEKK